MIHKLNPYAKAIMGAIGAALGAALTGMTGDGSLSPADWLGIATAAFTTLGVVWGASNTPAPPPAI